jgi:hypothetical protein
MIRKIRVVQKVQGVIVGIKVYGCDLVDCKGNTDANLVIT